MNKFIIALIIVVLLVGGYLLLTSIAVGPTVSVTPTATSSPMPSTPLGMFENEHFTIALEPGWTAQTVANNPNAINITKGNYVLYVNADFKQASGVQGGRFAEIAQGAPSADLVMKSQPAEPCGNNDSTTIYTYHIRHDLYVSSTTPKANCNVPASRTVWYFSYISPSQGGYINYYDGTGNSPDGYVATMAYTANNVSSLPQMDDGGLNTALDEMTTMVQNMIVNGRPLPDL